MSPNATVEVPTKYRAELVMSDGTALTLAHNDKKVLQKNIENLFTTQTGLTPQQRGKPLKFQEEENGWITVYHESFNNGQSPWTCIAEVPDPMNIQQIAAERFRQQKAA